MGILNVTPDSFSDGGIYTSVDAAVKHGVQMTKEGADLIDVGGESTRPGSEPVPAEIEIDRILPVIAGLVEEGITVSVDTMKPEVAREALRAGAVVVNDVNGLRTPGMIEVCAEARCTVCIMHMLGEPRTMQVDPRYDDVVFEVRRFLVDRAESAMAGGIARENVWIDPGFGFGKTFEHNFSLLKSLRQISVTGYPVLVGLSRKSFVGQLMGGKAVDDRLGASLAAAVFAALHGASIFRVHDVEDTKAVLTSLRRRHAKWSGFRLGH